jgi:hypothetical protein
MENWNFISHLDDTVLSRDIQIQGYHDNILRKDRNCFGGGVLVDISETLKVKRREDLEFENSKTFIILLKELLFSTNKSIFRSPVIMTFVVIYKSKVTMKYIKKR